MDRNLNCGCEVDFLGLSIYGSTALVSTTLYALSAELEMLRRAQCVLSLNCKSIAECCAGELGVMSGDLCSQSKGQGQCGKLTHGFREMTS